tara:strand:- start:1050 stop:1493 length:444 start_codon:yes stop_codon:yes gene_type:complete
MGLDMYLTAKRYISDYDDSGKALRDHLEDLKVNGMTVKELSYEAGYWRKANHIHKWFVDNVQGGVDNCAEYLVSVADLEKLLALVNEVLTHTKKAKELLPTSNGFFFGSDLYNDGYYEDLIHTKAIIENVLSITELRKYDIYYSSSW